jgi:glycosyltransferase involved in cell wall biosynthesis
LAEYINQRIVKRKKARGLNNGFDRDDYSGRKLEKAPDDFNIVHIGDFSGKDGVANIISGFTAASESDTKFAQNAKLYLIGGNPEEYQVLADKFDVHDKVFAPGYLPYRDAVRAAGSADLNLLQMGTEVGEVVVPGKFYIYVGAEKPIMAVVPEGEAKRLLTELCKPRIVASPEDVPQIADAFLRAFNDKTPQRIDREKAKRYNYQNIAEEIAALLDKITAKSRM